jgi:hypothetical protein
MEAALDGLLPRIIGDRGTWKIINYRNKQRLLRNLPDRLRGYRGRLRSENLKICVLIDRDEADCHTLKTILEEMAIEAGSEQRVVRLRAACSMWSIALWSVSLKRGILETVQPSEASIPGCRSAF